MMATGHSFRIEFSRRGDHMVGRVTGNTQVRLDEYALSVNLFQTIPRPAGDLLRIGLAAYAADRLARRNWRRVPGGSRAMELTIGVAEPDFWRDESVTGLVRDALQLLSGDQWHVRFSPAQPDPDYLGSRTDQHPRVCLYSGGLDSAAGLATRLRVCREPVLAVTAWHQARQRQRTVKQLQHLASRYGADISPIVVRTACVNPPSFREQEPTQRCRSFLFAALAGAVACAEGSSVVEMYENGVGVINLPLMHGMATGARTTKSSHPRFVRLMTDLVSRVAERRIDYSLPHRSRTKAEIVRALFEDSLADVALETVSCVHYPLRRKAKQCGYCPACIGRRQALILAGIREPGGRYEYDLFGPSEITNSIDPAKLTGIKATLMQVDRLADLRRRPLPDWFLQYALGTGVENSVAALEGWLDVLLRYRSEWLDLVESGQSKGWKWAGWLPVSSAA